MGYVVVKGQLWSPVRMLIEEQQDNFQGPTVTVQRVDWMFLCILGVDDTAGVRG